MRSSYVKSLFQALSAAASKLRALKGWRRYGAALLLGLPGVLAFAPFNATPILWLLFPAQIVLLQGTARKREAFWVGWCFAFAFLVPNLYWVAGALFVDIGTFWWVLPFALFGLPALFAFYYALAALLARRLFDLHKPEGVVAFGLSWFFADYMRGHLFTGFPWDLLGYVWSGVLPILQLTSLVGMYGLSLITAVVVCLPALLVSGTVFEARRAARLVGLSLLLLLAAFVWGEARLAHAPTDTVPDVRLRLVQPALSQRSKWRADDREKNFQELLDLSFAPAEPPVTHIIWPETATAFYLGEDIPHRLALAARLPLGAKLITGVVQRQRVAEDKIEYYNSLVVIDDTAHLIAGYDKFHLVPFGEYIPFRRWLPAGVTGVVGIDFTPGDGPHSLHKAGLPPFSPLVCYEAIFPGEVADRKDPPELLINVTNDAWYEGTIGPDQHFAIARVRAIEEGVPLVRVANKGIVGIVDGYGRIRVSLGPQNAGFVDGDLPRSTHSRTVFSLYGDWPLSLLLVALSLYVVLRNLKTRIPL
jgi:apolipoprotein N-acyltransferase